MTDSDHPTDAHESDAGARRVAREATTSGHEAHYPDPDIDNPDEPRCPVCGGAIDQTDVVCPHCGESLVAG